MDVAIRAGTATTVRRDIALLSRARKALAEAKTIDDVKAIRDQGHAAIQWAKSRRDIGVEAINDAAEIVLDAERKLGAMLAETVKRGRPDDKADTMSALSEFGITHKQSSRWQTEARVPEDDFRAWVARMRTDEHRLTSSGLRKFAKQLQAKEPSRELAAGPEGCFSSLAEIAALGHRFACIYADPPWRYGNQGTRAATDNHYPTMTVAEICAEPVADVAAEKCHLYLWTTTSFLRDAFSVIDAWGFTYKTNMVWVKPQMGIGNYVRVSHEHLLLAVRGKTRTRGSKQMSWIQAARTTHSRKPREFREAIEQMSDGPYLEMYGREVAPGWMVYGNQIERMMF